MIRYLRLAAIALVALNCREAPAFVQPPASEYTAATFELATASLDTILGAAISPQFFRVMAVRPLLGRLFIDSDYQPAGTLTAVISNDLWKRRFGAERAIVGRTIRLNGGDVVVVAVMPENVEFPKGAAVWVPRR